MVFSSVFLKLVRNSKIPSLVDDIFFPRSSVFSPSFLFPFSVDFLLSWSRLAACCCTVYQGYCGLLPCLTSFILRLTRKRFLSLAKAGSARSVRSASLYLSLFLIFFVFFFGGNLFLFYYESNFGKALFGNSCQR